MTARSKVTLVEAQQIRAKLIGTVEAEDSSFNEHMQTVRTVDALLALGLIDTDAALRLVATDE